MSGRTILETAIIILTLVHVFKAHLNIRSSDRYADENHDFSITCRATSNVSPTLNWFRNNHSIAFIRTSECSPYVVPNLSDIYKFNCTDNRSSTVIIPSSRINKENGSIWRCSDFINKTIPPVRYTVTVYRSPKFGPAIIGYEGAVLYPGNTVHLACTIDGGIPLANLSWTCKGNISTGSNITTSTNLTKSIRFTIDSSYNEKKCLCKASHLLWKKDRKAESREFLVYFPPPGNLTITGYSSLQPIHESQTIELTCTVDGGNPLATYFWVCTGVSLNNHNLTKDGSVLPLHMNKSFDGKQCICYSKHPTNISKTTSVTFTVYYPPKVNPVFLNGTEGETVSMFCLAQGKPNTYNYTGWIQTNNNKTIRSYPDLNSLMSSNGRNLTLSSTSYQDIGTYTCMVTNNIPDGKGVLIQSGSLYLDIQFKAVFTKTYIYFAEENKAIDMKIPFYCNPAVVLNNITVDKDNGGNSSNVASNTTFKLSLIDTQLQLTFHGRRVMVDGQAVIIKIDAFKMDFLGNYTITVQNMENLQSQLNFEIILSENKSQLEKESKHILVYILVGVAVCTCILAAVFVGIWCCKKGLCKRKGADPRKKYEASKCRKTLNTDQAPPYATVQKQPRKEGSREFFALDHEPNIKNEETNTSNNETSLVCESKSTTPDDHKPDPVYAEVQKPKKKAKSIAHGQKLDNNEYNSQSNGEKNSTPKTLLSNEKSATKETGSRYELVEDIKPTVRSEENYVGTPPGPSGKLKSESSVSTAPVTEISSNINGLDYADLAFDPQVNKEKSYVRNGQDNVTTYSEIGLITREDPQPSGADGDEKQ